MHTFGISKSTARGYGSRELKVPFFITKRTIRSLMELSIVGTGVSTQKQKIAASSSKVSNTNQNITDNLIISGTLSFSNVPPLTPYANGKVLKSIRVELNSNSPTQRDISI